MVGYGLKKAYTWHFDGTVKLAGAGVIIHKRKPTTFEGGVSMEIGRKLFASLNVRDETDYKVVSIGIDYRSTRVVENVMVDHFRTKHDCNWFVIQGDVGRPITLLIFAIN